MSGGGGGIPIVSDVWNEVSGANAAARAAQNAANATAAEAKNQRSIILAEGRKNQEAMLKLAEATPQEMAALDRSYAAANTTLDRQEKLINAIDPSLMEASKQALSILRGESNAGITNSTNNLRTAQRTKLVNQLREQYGPGAELSSIGQKALQAFDLQTDQLNQSNNSNALNQLLGIATTDVTNPMNNATSGLMRVGQGYGAVQDRKLNAQQNSGNAILNALSGTSSAIIQSAGAPYVGDAIKAQSQGQMFNTALNAGLLYATGGFSAAKPGGAFPQSTTYGVSGPSIAPSSSNGFANIFGGSDYAAELGR